MLPNFSFSKTTNEIHSSKTKNISIYWQFLVQNIFFVHWRNCYVISTTSEHFVYFFLRFRIFSSPRNNIITNNNVSFYYLY